MSIALFRGSPELFGESAHKFNNRVELQKSVDELVRTIEEVMSNLGVAQSLGSSPGNNG